MLKAKKEELDKSRRSLYHHFSKKFVDRLITRNVILGYNKLFIKEWKEMDYLRENGIDEEYKNAKKLFEKRWYISHPGGSHITKEIPSYYSKLLWASPSEGKIELVIDINGPTTKILEEVKDIVNTWKEDFKEVKNFWNENSEKFNHESFTEIEKRSRVPGNFKSDIEYYDLIMEIYAAKEDGNSWKQITDRYQLNSIDTAINHYNAAEKLIENGLPGLPPFPTK